MRPVATFLSALILSAFAGSALAQEEVVVTGGSAPATENADSQRLREAVAYATSLPRGAPDADYPLVAWCEAMVSGHAALGGTLSDADDLDRELIDLGRAEAQVFHRALAVSAERQTAETLAAARQAAAEASARWAPLMTQDETVRDQAFGLFMGLPGRCEHAARRIRDDITTPPATLAEVGLED